MALQRGFLWLSLLLVSALITGLLCDEGSDSQDEESLIKRTDLTGLNGWNGSPQEHGKLHKGLYPAKTDDLKMDDASGQSRGLPSKRKNRRLGKKYGNVNEMSETGRTRGLFSGLKKIFGKDKKKDKKEKKQKIDETVYFAKPAPNIQMTAVAPKPQPTPEDLDLEPLFESLEKNIIWENQKNIIILSSVVVAATVISMTVIAAALIIFYRKMQSQQDTSPV